MEIITILLMFLILAWDFPCLINIHVLSHRHKTYNVLWLIIDNNHKVAVQREKWFKRSQIWSKKKKICL